MTFDRPYEVIRTRSDVALPMAGVADVAPAKPVPVDADCCTDHQLDRDGAVRVGDIIVGYVAPNRWSRRRTWVVYRVGERTPMSFPGRNSIFRDRREAAAALAELVRR